MRFLIVTISLVLTVLASSVALTDTVITPSAVLSHVATYDGQHVSVRGTVSDVREKTSRSGNDYEVFELCDSQCIHVFAWGHPTLSEGQHLTVHGTFSAVKHVGSYTFYNEIEADENSL